MVQHGVAEHEVEALIGERQALGVDLLGLHLETEPLGVRAQRREHARRDVGARRFGDHPGAQQVEREVAGAGADLERACPAVGVVPDGLVDLDEHLLATDLAEVDSPLGVVVIRGYVVVARVDVADLLCAQGWWHGGAPYTRAPCSCLLAMA